MNPYKPTFTEIEESPKDRHSPFKNFCIGVIYGVVGFSSWLTYDRWETIENNSGLNFFNDVAVCVATAFVLCVFAWFAFELHKEKTTRSK